MKTVKILIKKDSSPAPAESSSSSSTAVTGTLRVNYAAGQTAPEDGKWYLDGDEASQYNFGSEAQVEFGTHSVYLTDVEGYDAPSAQEVVIDSVETKTIECSPYILIESSSSSSSSEAVMTLPPNNEIWYYASSQVTLNNEEDLSGHTFSDGKGVLTFNNDVTEVKDWLKETAITNVELPSGVTTIGVFAFRECTSLAITELPSGVTEIGYGAFWGCTSLAITELPSGVTYLGDKAFSGCTNLAITELPSGVTNIWESTFNYCTSLTTLTFKGIPTSIFENAFSGCTNLSEIYVPWASGAVLDAPWGATSATIYYNYNGSSSSSSSEES